MAKDPAFLFYPNDWIGGTMGMTFEEKGAYMELLMMQFNRGHMTEDMIGRMIGQLWLNIKDKFEQDEKGLFYNKRLDEEKEKRKRFTESRNNNRKGKNQYSNKSENSLAHMTSHMENENVDENKKLRYYREINDILKITKEEADELMKLGYTELMLNKILDKIENFRMKGKYTSLFLTAKDWLSREYDEALNKKKSAVPHSDNNIIIG